MTAREEFRAKEFLLWATFDFDYGAWDSDFNLPLIHWAYKASNIGFKGRKYEYGNSLFDYIQAGSPEDRSARFLELAN